MADLTARVPRALVLALGAATLLALPFAQRSSALGPSWDVAYLTALVGLDLMTCWLLALQFRSSGRTPLLVITAGYLWSGALLVPFAVTYPGVLGERGLVGGDLGVTGWLWILAHLGFPVVVGLALAPHRGSFHQRRVPDHRRDLNLVLATGLVLVAATGLVALVLTDAGRLTRLVGGHDRLPVMVVLVVGVVAVVQSARGVAARGYPGLEPWVLLALVASLCDVVLSLAGGGAQTFGALASQVASLVASGAVLMAIMGEVGRMYRTLATRNEELAAQVAHDPLTGLANRTGLEAAATVGAPALVAMLDLDHFKAVNDTYGHAVGDEVLVAVAARMQSTLRPGDLIGRWGGEEFLLLVRESDPDLSVAVVTRLLEAVRGTPVTTSAGPVEARLSAGAVLTEPGESLSSAAARADRWLYRAKSTGRDRLVVGRSPRLPRQAGVVPSGRGVPSARRGPDGDRGPAVSGRSASSR